MSLLHLVGHDGTSCGDDALALSRVLAPQDGVRRVVVHVVEPPGPGAALGADARGAKRDEAGDRLAPLRASLHAGEELRLVDAPSVAHGLHGMAEHEGAALVVVGSSHRGAAGLALLGTVADRLLHGSPCPVAMAALGFAGAGRAVDRVLLAYDGSAEAEGALAWADAVAHATRSTVDVISVQTPPAYFDHAGLGNLPPALFVEPAERAAAFVARAVEVLGDNAIGATLAPLWPTGKAIVAASEAVDLIVCGSRAYGPLRHVLLGSTGHFVLHHAACSVVIVPRAEASDAAPSFAAGDVSGVTA